MADAQHLEVHMRDTDAFAWYMEDDPLLRSTTTGVLLFDRAPEWDMFVSLVDRATRHVVKFRQKLMMPPLRTATPRWTYDSDFDLSWHLRRIVAPPPHDLSVVLEFARKEFMHDFDRQRPLWEFTMIEGLQGGQAALVAKVHHSLSDGLGAMQFAQYMVDFQREPTDKGPMPPEPKGEDFGAMDLLKDAIGHDLHRIFHFARRQISETIPAAVDAVKHPRDAMGAAVETAKSVARFVAPVSDTLSPVMTERHFQTKFRVIEVPFADLRRASKAVGGTVNDGFMAGVTGGLRLYHERHHGPVEELRVTMPISIRTAEDAEGGNRITLMRFKVPVGIPDPGERIRALSGATREKRAERSIPLTDAIAGTLLLLPNAYIGGMLKHVDFLCSNVPGFPMPIYMAGAEVLRFFPFGPTIGTAVNVTLLSYRGTCCIGVNTDAGAVPDTDVFMDCMREGFEEVLALGGEHLPVHVPPA